MNHTPMAIPDVAQRLRLGGAGKCARHNDPRRAELAGRHACHLQPADVQLPLRRRQRNMYTAGARTTTGNCFWRPPRFESLLAFPSWIKTDVALPRAGRRRWLLAPCQPTIQALRQNCPSTRSSAALPHLKPLHGFGCCFCICCHHLCCIVHAVEAAGGLPAA